MSIQKLSSAELMDILKNSQKSVEDLENKVSTINKNISNELNVLQSAQEFSLYQTNVIMNKIHNINSEGLNNKIMFVEDEIIAGRYEKYGTTIHPAFVRTPTDIFNINTSQGIFFKNNVSVCINNDFNDEYKYMLMNDSIPEKGISYNEFQTNMIQLSIIIDPNKAIGSSKVNTLEILPYLPGSYTIKSLAFVTNNDYRNKSEVPTYTYVMDMEGLGQTRILLGRDIDMYRCNIMIKLNFKNSRGLYPFGLKHLYFLKAGYDANSYVVMKTSRNKYIDTISEAICLHSQDGKVESTCTDEHIQSYMTYSNSELSSEIKTSEGIFQYPIAKNIKEFYTKIPINRAMVSMQFKEITER